MSRVMYFLTNSASFGNIFSDFVNVCSDIFLLSQQNCSCTSPQISFHYPAPLCSRVSATQQKGIVSYCWLQPTPDNTTVLRHPLVAIPL